MPRQLVREAYDAWEQPLEFVLATVADDFDMERGPIPADAPKQFFATNEEVLRAIWGDDPPWRQKRT